MIHEKVMTIDARTAPVEDDEAAAAEAATAAAATPDHGGAHYGCGTPNVRMVHLAAIQGIPSRAVSPTLTLNSSSSSRVPQQNPQQGYPSRDTPSRIPPGIPSNVSHHRPG